MPPGFGGRINPLDRMAKIETQSNLRRDQFEAKDSSVERRQWEKQNKPADDEQIVNGLL